MLFNLHPNTYTHTHTLWVKKMRLGLRTFSRVTQLLSTSTLVSLTSSPSTSSCHHCCNLTWFNIFLCPIMHPFQFHSIHIYWEFTMSPTLCLVLEILCQTLETWAEWQAVLLGRQMSKRNQYLLTQISKKGVLRTANAYLLRWMNSMLSGIHWSVTLWTV